jgi:outer membrane receptor protein involved in Fe transport
MLKSMTFRSTLAAVACAISLSAHAMADSPKRIDVPAGELIAALESLARQSGVEIAYSTEQLKGVKTHGVHGTYTAEKAATKLLEGTKLTVTTHESGGLLIAGPGSALLSIPADSGKAAQAAQVGSPDQKEGKKSSSDNFRLAQMDQAAGSQAAAVDRSSPSQEGGPRLGEVVVTARKRTEDVSKVPISIAVLTRDEMDEQLVQDISDVANRTPGVDYENQGILNLISIRGITSSAGASTGAGGYSTTGIYIDDVPIQVRQTAANEWNTAPKVFDLDRVEVLRGPQGTLFGAGAEGGIIRFITPQPSLEDFSTYVRGGVGTTDNGGPSYEIGAAFGGPIVHDELGFRISAWHRRDGAYIDHDGAVPGTYDYPGSNWTDSDVVRAAFTFAPAEFIQITPSIYYQHIYYHDNPVFTPAESSAANNTYTTQLQGLDIPYSNIGAGRFVDPQYQQEPASDQFYIPALKLHFEWAAITLTSSTSYMDRSSQNKNDWSTQIAALVGLPWPRTADFPSDFLATIDQYVFTQELRLQSSNGDRPLQWTIGAYYARSRETTGLTLTAGSAGPIFGLPPSGVLLYGTEPDTVDTQRAIFGDATYRVSKHVSLTAGVRAARNGESYSYNAQGPIASTAPFHAEQSEHAVDPRFGINVQLNDQNLLYISAARGSRIGGVNTPVTIATTPPCAAQLAALGISNGVPPTYKTDWLWSYEAGAKSRLFDGHLQLDGSVFHIDWSDVQQPVNLPACSQTFTTNLGKAVSNGFDLEATTLVSDSVKLGLAVSYTDAKNADTINVTTQSGVAPVFADGQQLNPYSSPWILSASAEYNFVVRTYQMYLRAFDTYRSRNPGPYQVPLNSPVYNPYFIPNPSTNQLDMHLGVTRSGWDISLYALNVLNQHPVLYDGEFAPYDPPGTAYTIRPLTVGLNVAFRH